MQYIVFDLEATCWKKKPREAISELIEIGAAKLDGSCRRIDTFNTFVRPTRCPALSKFYTQLTSITQQDVDNAAYFDQAMLEF